MSPKPPIAPKRPKTTRLHGDTIVDDYAWLEDRDDPEVLAYLEAENAYTRAALEPLRPLVAALAAEMRGRLKEDDESAPAPHGPYAYFTRMVAGGEYPVYLRRGVGQTWDVLETSQVSAPPPPPEELLIDGNALGQGEAYFAVGPFAPSPDHSLLAYGVDTTGSYVYTLYLKDLRSGALLDAPIPNTAYEVAWAADGASLFYCTFDHTHRAHRLYRHVVGSDPATDTLVYEEADGRFEAQVERTRSGRFLVLTLRSNDSTEVHYAPADRPDAFTCLQPRRPKVEYFLDHQGDRLVIRTNEGAENFRLLAAPEADPRPERWAELLPHRADTLITGTDAFADFLVVYERRGGLEQIRVSNPDGSDPRYVEFPEPVYTIEAGPNHAYQSDTLRFSYSSLITPTTTVDYGMRDGSWTVRKREEIPSGYDPSRYVCERIVASAPDGAQVPISIAYRTAPGRDPGGPALLIGYGAYGWCYEPEFDQKLISLLDRGFLVGIAHIRGGSDMGRAWYEQGRMLHKRNTFSDFIACAERLVELGLTTPRRLAIRGTSAGGLLMSAVANARPELFGAVLARVPWTNVIASLTNPDLPLTQTEWEQWGNPAIEEQYRYLAGYDPYQQIEAKAYPPIMATGGLNDLQVPYWDPAKWVARLRAHKTDQNPLILRTNMSAGHGGSAGRYRFIDEAAEEYAFLIWSLGAGDTSAQ